MTANQSRRRVEKEMDTPTADAADTELPFCYEPLNAGTHSTRLLTIQRSTAQSSELSCKLIEVRFGDKPRYEALSYTWGDTAEKLPVLVNGQQFLVGRNLYDALHYLRNHGRKCAMWIDAICINQDDVAERNGQLRIMHHIYSRATTVMVWLGQEYAKYDNLMVSVDVRQDEELKLDSKEAKEVGLLQLKESDLVRDLCKDKYWQRLWIVQEIGQAEHIEVCFGASYPMSWEHFIHLITTSIGSDDVLFTLKELRVARERGSYPLRKLLLDHRRAKCKEPRDKVYGLIGLAADAYGFPMDYTKPLIQVWNDVMSFTYKRGLLPDEEVVTFGGLVKYLLMGNDTSPLQQVLQPHGQTDINTAVSQKYSEVEFEIEGYLLGQITHIGPSTIDIVGDLDSVDRWNAEVQQSFRDVTQRANLESRDLMRATLSPKPIRTCFSHIGTTEWSVRTKKYQAGSWDSYLDALLVSAPPSSNVVATHHDEHGSSQERFFQLRNRRYGSNINWRMGITTHTARKGDLLVLMLDVREAVVIRPKSLGDNQFSLHIIGTAWMTDDLAEKQEELEARRKRFCNNDCVRIRFDTATCFILASSWLEERDDEASQIRERGQI